ncbi:putative repressor of RNA polymerase III transcription Maf1 [Helianthus anomalus]
MKYLEYTPFDRINAFLDHLNLGEHTIKGCIEAYSCKHTGTDKRLSLSLENEMLEYIGNSPDVGSSSPVEYLSSRSSRKTLIYLILTLSQMYPDYDFSAVKAHRFFTEGTWEGFKQIFQSYMSDASKVWNETDEDGTLLETLYKTLDEVINLADCEVYSYDPNSDADPFIEKGALWSYNFFFYNRKLKRVVWNETDEDGTLLETLYKTLDEVINLADCEVYSYDPNSDADPFIEKGALWSYNFFFYNRKLKRVVSFCFSCLSNLVSDGFPTDGFYYEEDGEIFDEMDM